MSLPTPQLDDRRFQDLVDEAKRLIPRYCPEWTDHNLSDPGITLIEIFAWMTEMILYRVNQVPDKHYIKFLELMGVRLFPGAAARAPITFWLSTRQPEAVRIPAGTQVGTVRTEQQESVVFMTDDDLVIVVPQLAQCLTSTGGARYEDCWDDLHVPGEGVTCFPSVQPDDAIYFGFTDSLAGNIIRLDCRASLEGRGVDPKRPPWSWELWGGESWLSVRIYRDETGGLNRDGGIVLACPTKHEPLTVGPGRAHWLRCRMTPGAPGQPTYQNSPRIHSVSATSLGGITLAHHAEPVSSEALGRSKGIPGQVFSVRRAPVLPRKEGERVVVVTPDGAAEWTEVTTFSASGPGDLAYIWDSGTGEIEFGPLVHHPDGSTRQHGAVPPLDSEILVTRYRYGGGARGNVGARTLSVLKSSIPFVARVENSQAATGGVDPETIENAAVRGPMTLRTGQRAVTAQDFERLTLEASPLVARARCLPPSSPGGPVKVLIVPRVNIAPDRLVLDDLALDAELVAQVSAYLDERRILTTAVEIATPYYQGLTVVARVRGQTGANPQLLRDRLLTALYGYVNPLSGGPEGTGWPFGRELNLGEVFALLSGVEGVLGVEEVSLFLADLATGERREGRQRAPLGPDAVFASFQHQVLVP